MTPSKKKGGFPQILVDYAIDYPQRNAGKAHIYQRKTGHARMAGKILKKKPLAAPC